MGRPPGTPHLATLRDSFVLHLQAEHKSPQTIKSYCSGVDGCLDHCAQHDLPAALARRTLDGYIVGLLAAGRAPATARARQLGVRQFSAWLAAEGEIDVDPLLGAKPPKLDVAAVEPLTDDDLKALIKACAGRDLRERRDEAIIWLMSESGRRAGEVVALDVTDVDLKTRRAVVRRGKRGKGRVVPFGAQPALAVDRYLRVRRTHRLAASSALWLGDRGKRFTYDALHKTLAMRATMAGVDGFHPHLLRHTAAHRWLAAGGAEGGLMAVAGWTRPDMIQRYTRARASERAAAEAEQLGLGDI